MHVGFDSGEELDSAVTNGGSQERAPALCAGTSVTTMPSEPNPGLPAWVDNLAKGGPVAHCPHQEVGAAADTLDCQQRERTPHRTACPTLLLLLCYPGQGVSRPEAA